MDTGEEHPQSPPAEEKKSDNPEHINIKVTSHPPIFFQIISNRVLGR